MAEPARPPALNDEPATPRLTARERRARFEQIKDYYDRRDAATLRAQGMLVHDTPFGIWGTTHLDDAFAFFTRIHLERFAHVADLGCGDGRVVAIASLFTTATGVEGDGALARAAQDAVHHLGLNATIRQGDYYAEDFSRYDCLFMFPDKRYDAAFMQKLSTFTGYLFVYTRIFRPPGLRAGKTYWVGQIPIASYPVGVEDRDLEQHTDEEPRSDARTQRHQPVPQP